VVGPIDPFVTTLSAPTGSGFGGGETATYLSQVGGQRRQPQVSNPPVVQVQVPQQEVALRLRIGPGAQVVSRYEQRFVDDTPWSLQTSFYPMEFALGAPKLLTPLNIDEGAVRYLEAILGLEQVGFRDWITARTPDDNEQSFFGIEHDATVFEIFRTAFDDSGRPLRVTVTVFSADRNQFIVDSGKVPAPQYDLPAEPETQASKQETPAQP
jgi:GntR family transcriptional regulator